MNIVIAFTLIIIAIAILWKNEKHVPESMTTSVYLLPKKWRIVICLLLWSAVFFTIPSIMVLAGSSTRWMAFLAIAGVVICGAIPVVEDTDDVGYKIHQVIAVVSMVLSQLFILTESPLLIVSGWLVLGVTKAVCIKKKTPFLSWKFWMEAISFIVIFLFCLI